MQSEVPAVQPAPHERDAYETLPSRAATQAGEKGESGGGKRKAVVGAKFSLPESSQLPGYAALVAAKEEMKQRAEKGGGGGGGVTICATTPAASLVD